MRRMVVEPSVEPRCHRKEQLSWFDEFLCVKLTLERGRCQNEVSLNGTVLVAWHRVRRRSECARLPIADVRG